MITFLPIQENDLPQLAQLYTELSGEESNLEKMRRQFAQLIQKTEYLLLGGKDETGQLVASVMAIRCLDLVGSCQDFMVLENVVVRSTCRKQGIGRQMMTYIENYARENACNYIILVSSGFRKDAHQFYEAMGYTEDVRGFRKYLENNSHD